MDKKKVSAVKPKDKRPKRLFVMVQVTEEERETLRRNANRDGYHEVAPWMRRLGLQRFTNNC